jgi:hypothetical protein
MRDLEFMIIKTSVVSCDACNSVDRHSRFGRHAASILKVALQKTIRFIATAAINFSVAIITHLPTAFILRAEIYSSVTSLKYRKLSTRIFGVYHKTLICGQ